MFFIKQKISTMVDCDNDIGQSVIPSDAITLTTLFGAVAEMAKAVDC